jgi:uncharacterized protein (DUF952 family)
MTPPTGSSRGCNHGSVQIFHIAELAHWTDAQEAGAYRQSTVGRTLDEEGFIHAARGDQWDDVRRRYYSGVKEPLILLVIDTDRLTSPWQEDSVGGTTYPHIYGPLNPDAVVATVPLDGAESTATATRTAAATDGRTFTQVFFGEMSFRMVAGAIVMGFALLCALVGVQAAGDAGGLVGILAGLAVGIVAAVAVARRRDERLS